MSKKFKIMNITTKEMFNGSGGMLPSSWLTT
jgi:hypothetical protein